MELTESNNDLENLNGSTKIATIFLDENKHIRKYTPMFSRIYKIIESDVGRPFNHLSHRLLDVNPSEVVKQVLQDDEAKEQEVVDESGNRYLMRVHPYHIAPEVYSGAVLTFFDINAYHAEHAMLEAVMNSMMDVIIVIDEQGVVQRCNPASIDMLGYTPEELIGEKIQTLIPHGEDRTRHDQYLANYLRTGESRIIGMGRDVKALCKTGEMRHVHLSVAEIRQGERRFFAAALHALSDEKA